MIDGVNIANVKEENCCGCSSCAQSCPKTCITMQENERGFLVPIVNMDICIRCGLCLKVCPEIDQPHFNPPISAYAAISKVKSVVYGSTSGGVFTVISEFIIKQKGIVYGCGWNDDLSTKHIRVKSINDLNKIQKSKYIQSDIQRSYLNVEQDLKKGKKVLFSGTACQVAGLRKFLRKSYTELLTIEVACHGVPSPGLFRMYIGWIEKKYKKKVITFQFRNKVKHKKGEHYKLYIKFKDGTEKYIMVDDDPYYSSFLKGKTLRKTCYECKYKSYNRVGDIMLSDFWGIEKEHPSFPAQNGASAIIITSIKGQIIFNSIRNNLIIEKSSYDRIVSHNHSLQMSAKCVNGERLENINKDIDELFTELKGSFSFRKRLKYLIPERLKYVIKRFYK